MAIEQSEYYRAIAQKMLDQAGKATTAGAKSGFLTSAASWHAMADKIEDQKKK